MKLEMINYLLKDTEQEIQNFKDYHAEEKRARKESEQQKENKYPYWHFLKWNKPTPKKAKIQENLKMIRRLSLEFEKEFDERKL